MICEITNKLTKSICWLMAYGTDDDRTTTPDCEVSIKDFITTTSLVILMVILIAWWYIPCVWLYNNDIWEDTDSVLNKKRFKCKGVKK